MNDIQQENILLTDKRPIVIIGTGPIGVRFLEELVDKALHHPIIIYGDEPYEPYNRVRLSSLLAGEVDVEEIMSSSSAFESNPVIKRLNCKIVHINRDDNTVTDEFGDVQAYQTLILATGSQAFIPNIEGVELNNVFKFRDLNDTERLIARRVQSRKTIVLGGGLLGLEAARAMQRFSTDVSVIEHNHRLLFNQLDDTGSEIFAERIKKLGINVYINNSVVKINGNKVVESVELKNGTRLKCDTLIISAGIRSNIDLAKQSGLAFGRGIKVNDVMQTSDPDIYAIGECCEHQGQVYGIVSPGLEQAVIAARHILALPSQYKGTVLSTSLKVVGYPVFSMGDVDESTKTCTAYIYKNKETYRRLNVYRGQVIGIVSIGQWDEIITLRERVKKGSLFFPWQLSKFQKTGKLWNGDAIQNVSSWPAETIICSCNSLSRGQLTKTIESGCNTVTYIAEKTGASTVCGSCKPLLADMLGGETLDPIQAWKPLFYGSMIFLLMGLFAYFFSAPYNDSVQVSWRWDELWTITLYKQISGFTLLGISIIVMILSLRKRIKWFSFGDFPIWRLLHALLGGSALFILLIHTGFRLGDNLNFFLMMSFSGLILIGAIVAAVIAKEHELEATTVKQVREIGTWLHILLVWPLPILLGLHIFKTYYF